MSSGGDRETVTVIVGAHGEAHGLRFPKYRLRVSKGPDKGREKTSASERTLIGTHPDADLTLEDAAVSALHCELLLDRSGLRVRDLGSKNGVFLMGRKVLEAYLADGDELVLGRSRIRARWLNEFETQAVGGRASLGGLRGSSVAMRRVYDSIERAAASDSTVLVTGETGTGKELAVEAVVAASARRDKPFVVVDCGAIPHGLGESALFGHEKGAFTSAQAVHIGAFERANGGTLFLDELGELPPHLQSALLGVLARGSIQRVGAERQIPIDVRVIAATHRDLERAVALGRFRPDLYFRLNVLRIHLAPLRDRSEDIPELVGHFLEQLGADTALAPAALHSLYQADYPGNVRELRNAVERAIAGLPAPSPSTRGGPDRLDVDLTRPYREQRQQWLNAFDRSYLQKLLQQTAGNVSEAARRSGINRVHLHRLLRALDIVPPER